MTHRGVRIPLALIVTALLVLGLASCSADDDPNADTNPASSFTQVPNLPAGATSCPVLFEKVVVPFNAGARGTPTTSCQLVEQVRREYARLAEPLSRPQQMRVPSPKTQKWIDLVCSPTRGYVTCVGGVAVVIYLYNP